MANRKSVRDYQTMKRDRMAVTRRLVASAAIALPMTVALLFLMTRLILPNEQDPIVARMLQNLELHRTRAPPKLVAIPAPRPPAFEISGQSPLERPFLSADTGPTEAQDTSNEIRIDWAAAARNIAQDSEQEDLERWLLENGHERYVTIMQGELPITNSVHSSLPPSQEDATGYLNSFGDMEIKVSENCVAQTLVSARLDISDFTKNLPMRIVCKSPPKIKYSFEPD